MKRPVLLMKVVFLSCSDDGGSMHLQKAENIPHLNGISFKNSNVLRKHLSTITKF